MDFSDKCRICLARKEHQNFTNVTNQCYLGKTFKYIIMLLVPSLDKSYLTNDHCVCEYCAESLKRSIILIHNSLTIESQLKRLKEQDTNKSQKNLSDKEPKLLNGKNLKQSSVKQSVHSRTTETTGISKDQSFGIPNVNLQTDTADNFVDLTIDENDTAPKTVNLISLTVGENNTATASVSLANTDITENSTLQDITQTGLQNNKQTDDIKIQADHDYCIALKPQRKSSLLNDVEEHNRVLSLHPSDLSTAEYYLSQFSQNGLAVSDISTNSVGGGNNKKKRILLLGTNIYTRCPKCFKCIKYFKEHTCMKRKKPVIIDTTPKAVEKCTVCDGSVRGGYMELHLEKHERDEHLRLLREKRKEAKLQAKLTCRTCKEKFGTTEEFRLHLELHPPFTCEICGKGFIFKESLRAHKNSHNKPNSFICEVCGKGYKDYGCLRTHQQLHQNNSFKCTYCPKVFKQKIRVYRHIKQVHEKQYRFQCTQCGKLFLTSNSHNHHVKLVHAKEKPFECNICQKRFGRADYLQNHRIRHSGLQPNAPKPRLSRRRLPKLRYKIEDNGQPVPCKFCGRWFKDMIRLKRHLETHLKRYPCQFCPLTFSRKAFVQRHERNLHEGTKDNFFRCNVCWKRLITKEALDEHVQRHDKPRHVCDLCGETFNRIFLLNHHKLMDHSSMPNADEAKEIIYDSLMEVSGDSKLIQLIDSFCD